MKNMPEARQLIQDRIDQHDVKREHALDSVVAEDAITIDEKDLRVRVSPTESES